MNEDETEIEGERSFPTDFDLAACAAGGDFDCDSSVKPPAVPRRIQTVKKEDINEEAFGFDFETETMSDWNQFIRDYRLESVKKKFESNGMENPLKILLDIIPLSMDDHGESGESPFDDLSDELKLTVLEKVLLHAGMRDYFQKRQRKWKEYRIQRSTFLDLRSTHIVDKGALLESEHRVHLSCAILGACNVGKSALVKRLVYDQYEPFSRATIGVDCCHVCIIPDPESDDYPSVDLSLWDTAGQERFRSSMSSQYYRGRDAFLFVYDVCDEDSIQRIQEWHSQMEDIVDINRVIRVMVGNKSDLLTDSSRFPMNNAEELRRMAADLASDLKMTLFEVSSKTGHNLVSMLIDTVKQVLDFRAEQPSSYLEFDVERRRTVSQMTEPITTKSPLSLQTCCQN